MHCEVREQRVGVARSSSHGVRHGVADWRAGRRLPWHTLSEHRTDEIACRRCPSLVPELVKGFRKERLSTLRPIGEFFDYQRISKPADLNEATQVGSGAKAGAGWTS